MNAPVNAPVNVLSVAGSDPSGGAGVQADLKTFSALGAYGLAVLTSLTAQNTRGVSAVHVPPPDFLAAQLQAVSDDVRVDAVKLGMLATAEAATVVADWLERTRPPIVVLDPVMVATSGDRLLDPQAVDVVRDRLVPLADLVTPNLPELAVLAGADPAPSRRTSWERVLADAAEFASTRHVRLLVKGGHLTGERAPDALIEPDGSVHPIDAARVDTRNTHGTGCTLSSAIAALKPVRSSWHAAVAEAKTWLTGALRASGRLDVGGLPTAGDSPSHGPVHHFHAVWPSSADAGPSSGFCDQAWTATAGLRGAIDDLPFLRELADGSLDPARFARYLAQDALYLDEFAKALARCAQLAPVEAERRWWLRQAAQCLEVEKAMHEAVLGPGERLQPTPVTLGYVNHLHAVGGLGDYGRLAAAVLPCFWIYADVGRRLADGLRTPHPYGDWIEQYADPGFEHAAGELREIVDRAAGGLPPAGRAAMLDAFTTSARYEWMFWDEAWRGGSWPPEDTAR